MHLKNLILYVGLVGLLAVSCRKDKRNDDNSGDPNACVEGNAYTSGSIIQGKYIVSFKSGTVSARANATEVSDWAHSLFQKHRISSQRSLKTFGGEHSGFIADLLSGEAEELSKDPSVSIVEPDRVIALSVCFTVVEPRLVTWNINRVGYGNGIGKTAWIIDTGIDFDHPDLTVDAAKSRSFINGTTSADDENGHGTHVAGIIGAKNNTIGVLGVASGANLVSLRVLNAEGVGTLSSIIQALAYVSANGKAGDVVNMSLGEDVNSPTLVQQVQSTASKGIYVSIAAGNDAEPANKYSPGNANGTNIYTVSAIDSLDRFASFSNYGNDVVDYAAPGVRVLSTFSDGRYAILSGTSMAAPHLAGLLLLRGSAISTSGVAQNDPDNEPDPIAHY